MEEDISETEVEILAPGEDVVVKASSISFHWAAVDAATSYHLQIATPNFEQPQQIVADTEVEDNFFTEELPENTYEWRVRAVNSGYSTSFATAGFTVESNEDFSSNRIVLLAPKDEFATNQEVVNLEWQEMPDATSYRVQITEQGNLIKEETTTKKELEVELPEGEFVWKVRAENETRNTFYSSRKIQIDIVSPAVPELIKPADESTLTTETVNFEWKREEKAGSAETDSLFVFKDVKMEELVEKEQVTTSHNTILERQENYYWYMRSYDAAGNKSERSIIFSFTVN